MRQNWLLAMFVCMGISAMADAQSPELVLQKGHFKKINSISFSKSGKQVITTGDDGSIKIWDAFSQKLLRELDGKGSSFNNAYFSSNDKYIIAVFSGNDLLAEPVTNIYNSLTGALVYSFGAKENFETIASEKPINTGGDHYISPNGELSVLHLSKELKYNEDLNTNKVIRDHPISIFYTGTGKLYTTINNFLDTGSDQPLMLGFVSDSVLLVGQTVVYPGNHFFITIYHVYDFLHRAEIGRFADTSVENKKGKLMFSPGGRFFLRYENENDSALDSAGPYTELWDIHERKLSWHRPIRMINAAFTVDDSEMLLNYDTLHFEGIYSGKRNLLEYRRITRFQLPAGEQVSTLEPDYLREIFPAYSPGGKYLAVGSMNKNRSALPIPHIDTSYTIYIREKSNTLISSCQLKNQPSAMAFTKDERYLVTGYENGNFSIWELGDSLATELSAVGNNIDPILKIHNDYYGNKMFYVTKNMFGVQPAQTSNKITFFSTGNTAIKDIHYFQHDNYSIIDAGPNDFGGKLMITDNGVPAVISEVSYEINSARSVTIESLLKNKDVKDVGRGILENKLQHPQLQSLSIYSSVVNTHKSKQPIPGNWMGFAGPPVVFTFGVIKSLHSIDTMLLFTTIGDFVYNSKWKGYIYRGLRNYLIPPATLAITPVSNSIKLMWSILSDDGNYTLGRRPDEGAKFRTGIKDDPIINNDKKLYCLDLKNNFRFSTPIVYQADSVGELSHLIFSPDNSTACILSRALYSNASFIRVVNAKNGMPRYNLKVNNSGAVLGVEFTRDSKYIYSWCEGGTCTKWDLKNGREIYTIVFFQDHDYAIILPGGYYFISSRSDVKYLNFKLNNRLYNFSQFDLQFNRPDKVLQAIGSPDKALIEEYYQAWQGRVKKSGFTDADINSNRLQVPEIFLKGDSITPFTKDKKITIPFTAGDSKYKLRSYNIFVNDVPIRGINGVVLNKPGHQIDITESLLLNDGDNKIEINCTNEKGIESRKEAFYIKYQTPVNIKHKTYFIGIGINDYSAHSSFVDLSYCVKDIRDLSAAFKGKFKEELIIDTLMNDNASRENILALKQKLMQTDVDDKVIVSFSGHGMVDPLHPGDFYFVTGSTDVNNPAANGISYAQLEELLDSIPARKKLMLLDACHSGESNDSTLTASNHIPGTKRGNDDKDKSKAGSIEILDVVENSDPAHSSSTDIFKLMKEAFVDIRRNNGAYVLSAAQSNESAGEGGGISNGWFSSCLIEQLKQNGSMRINELSEKVNQCVSAKSGGNQNTDNRQELAEFNWVLW